MTSLQDLELAVRMPWTVAAGDSLWIASGTYPDGGQFVECLVRCVPSYVHGTTARLFEVWVLGEAKIVGAADITRAREVLLVWADDPFTAVDPDEQAGIAGLLVQREDEIEEGFWPPVGDTA